jgi:hypothetical protein
MRGVIVAAIWIAIGFFITQVVASSLERAKTPPQVERPASSASDVAGSTH